ncbi:hypothetical protein PIB30_054654 [Stylosanthes scabra]|uniref:Uncharacterized protein n=1 Tax=Stylosanthes scabra TaxID=79078 RepID=A0ABU6ZHJ1_9FABA|nr:hypothetical protein [Stylosanthes scabra]
MAGFFSLGGRGAAGPHSNNSKEEAEERVEKHHHHHQDSSSLFLFRNNEEVYNNKAGGGFEIWPQPYHQNQQGLSNYYSFGVGPSSNHHHRRNNNNNNDNSNNNSNDEDVSFCVSDESTRFGLTVMRSSSGGGGGGGGVNCQDCGNQAKKDCAHLRCRTCCKSRGFQCQTHVKSTWVPAAKRRERQQQLAALHRSDTCSKRHRDAQQALDSLPCPPPVPTITTTGLELGQFPTEVSSSAVFRCVKVSAIDSADEQYAYQTAVNIGGHLFKGILYDQGPQGAYTTTVVAEGSSGGGGRGGAEPHHHQQQLSLITAATTTTSGNPFEPSSLYPAPLNAFMAGTQFFPPPRS